MPWQRNVTPPGSLPQTFTLIKVDLGPCYLLLLHSRLLHSFYVKTAGHKDSDIIRVRWYLCRKKSSKRNAAQGRNCLLIPKPTEQGIQSEDIEKRQGSTLRDWTLDRESLRESPVHLHHRLWFVVHHAYPFAKTRAWIWRFPEQSPTTDGQPYRRPWTYPNWSTRLQSRLITPLGSCTPSVSCLGLIFPSQRSSTRVRSNR